MLDRVPQDTKLLTRLGLTPLQVEVYLALAKMDKATIKTISSISRTDRANVHRVLTRLQELELVEKLLTYPNLFKALPPNEGVQMLLDRKEREHEEIKAQTKELLEKYKNIKQETRDEKICDFVLIPAGKFTKRKVAEMISSNQKTHDVIIYWSDFEPDTNAVVAMWQEVLYKSVKMRIIVFLQKNEKLPKKVLDLRKCPQFQIRKTPTPPKVTISIIDGKEALISVTPLISPRGKPGLWINNAGIVGSIQEYFESTWRNSEELP
jgi:HTH-type transcriptional regulator, sugar sensing transcriptional regulator